MKKIIILLALNIFDFYDAPVKKTKIVFFGDSITQAGVNKGGYIDRIQSFNQQQVIAGKI